MPMIASPVPMRLLARLLIALLLVSLAGVAFAGKKSSALEPAGYRCA